jgi:hypothetical protein
VQPLRLSDAELDAVLAAARPITPDRRDAFLQAIANILADQRELGPGVVFRIIRDVQREFFDPPELIGSSIRHGGYGY